MVCLVYTTVPDEKTGEEISRNLLDKNLIACANLMPAGKSFYMWEGKFQRAHEHLLFLKTRSAQFPEIEQEILRLHPSECPCIMAWNMDHGYPAFLEWVKHSLV